MLCLGSQSALADQFTATVDRTQIGVNETFQLALRYEGQVLKDPDFSALERDFEILNQQQSNQLSIINGKRDSYTVWTLQLLPKHSGKLLIPSLNLHKSVSNAIELTVSDSSPQASSDQKLFIETELDKEKVYVQEQLILTHRLYTRINLNNLASDDLQVSGANQVKLSENQYQKTLNGIPYLVVEIRYALFPQNSGTLDIPSTRFSASIPDNRDPFGGSFFSRGGKKVFLRTDQKQIEVMPRPAAIPLDEWIPSKGVSLTEKWSRPLDELRVGEPVTRTVTLVAQGLTGAQLPPVKIEMGAGYRVYPDQPQMSETTDSNGVMGSRTESLAIVPTQAGEIQLPPVTVRWWDTTSGQERETTIAAKTLNILPAIGTSSQPGAPEQPSLQGSENQALSLLADTTDSTPPLLLYLSSGLNLILLGVIGWLLFQLRSIQRRQPTSFSLSTTGDSEQEAFNALKSVSKSRPFDSDLFQRKLIAWARTFWPQEKIATLSQVANLSDNVDLNKALSELTRSSYGEQPTGNDDTGNLTLAKNIVEQLATMRKNRAAMDKTTGNNLKPLYET